MFMFCGVKGQRKTDGNHYYPALLKPRYFCSDSNDCDDISVLCLLPGGLAGYKANLRHTRTPKTVAMFDCFLVGVI
ncbi:hypothetical protein PAXRUDRAFT_831983 [Paxillus rubicundulus Ve08.2h10]|uniref:Uncharacterized protein n=1 Tax=Paxillus rubicundulus Ve08.2h10 TaxID=930991 RepID=A0A0D0DPX7_9AGAM|nr:hypothetical protein PAXRUDRAFT_831983 [Paxillus rubicundulus Ve08.2h10]